MPEDADTPKFRTNIGSVHYAPETSSIVWKIKQFGGGKEFLMRAELGLPSVRGDDEKGGGMMGGFGGSMGGVGSAGGKGKRPIQVKFEIPYFTTSGIQVRYLKIIEPKVSLIGHEENDSLTHHSYNILACHGFAISHRVVTSLSDFLMCSEMKLLARAGGCRQQYIHHHSFTMSVNLCKRRSSVRFKSSRATLAIWVVSHRAPQVKNPARLIA